MSVNNDFARALAALKAGQSIRRAGWDEGVTLSVSAGPEPKLVVTGAALADGIEQEDSPRGSVRFFTLDAVLAEDWEILD